MKSHRAVPEKLARKSIVVGLLVAIVAVAVGVMFGLSRPVRWTAESQAVVLPGNDLDAATNADYYETLSRGQIPATFAEVLNDGSYLRQAERAAHAPNKDRDQVRVEAVVVPNTALISVRVTAPTPQLAEDIANQLLRVAETGTEKLAKPYELSQVSNGVGTAVQQGLTTTQYVLLAVFLGLLAGVAAQQLTVQLVLARRRVSALPGKPLNGTTSRLVDHEASVENGVGAR